MKSRSAMTLLEVIVATGLAFLLAMGVFQVMIPTFRLVQQNQIYTEIQQQGILAMEQLLTDLQKSVPTGVTLANGLTANDGLIVGSQPLAEDLSSGLMVLDTSLNVIWLDVAKEQLFRRVYRQPDPASVTLDLLPNSPRQFSRTQLFSVTQYPNSTLRSLAKSVREFTVKAEGTSGGEVFACRILLIKKVPGKELPAQAVIVRKAMLRNHF